MAVFFHHIYNTFTPSGALKNDKTHTKAKHEKKSIRKKEE